MGCWNWAGGLGRASLSPLQSVFLPCEAGTDLGAEDPCLGLVERKTDMVSVSSEPMQAFPGKPHLPGSLESSGSLCGPVV